jgi:signal transduction histidine kinase/CheY-like chemotaxis protein
VTLALVLAVSAVVLDTATGLLQLALSRAPGWRRARTLAFIALTAAAYACADVGLATEGLSGRTYELLGRLNYVTAGLHLCGWLAFSYGGEDATYAGMSRRMRAFVVGVLAVTAIFAVTGAHLSPVIAIIDVGWLGRYHYPTTRPLGDAYGTALLAALGMPVWAAWQRVRRNERGARMQLWTFGVFFLCSVDEVLVANRVVRFVALGDLGFLSIVLGTSIQTVRQVVSDARDLAEVDRHLLGALRVRTEERNRAQEALFESERLASLGRLAAGVGHEINNPLVYMTLGLDRVAEHLATADAPDEVHEALADARDGAQRIQKVVEGLRAYSPRKDERVALDPRELVRSALKVTAPQLRHVARVEESLGPAPTVDGEEAALVQVLGNLLVNAAHAVAARGGGLGTVRVRTFAAETGATETGAAIVEVSDDGVGLSPEAVRRLGEPYFTTRAREGGQGLGLFVSRGILTAHGGRLEIESQLGVGTTMRVVLPARAMASAQAPANATPEPAPVSGSAAPSRGRLLLVDDDPAVLRSLARALKARWSVVGVSSGREALEAIERDPPDVLVCDLMMPGMSGIEVAEALRRTNPALLARTLFLTGGAVDEASARFLQRADVRHEIKPVRLEALERALASFPPRATSEAPADEPAAVA